MTAPVVAKPLSRVLWSLAWPTLLQNWLILAVNLSDRLLAGWNATDATLQSAQTTVYYLSWCLSALATLVNVGATVLVARMIGAEDRETARRVLHQALLCAFAVGLLSSAVLLSSLDAVMGLLHLTGPTAVAAADYLRPLLYQLPLHMVCLAGIACLSGAGDNRTGMYVLGSVAVVNLPLTWVCFHGFGVVPPLGFRGIAIGTAVAQTLGMVAVLAVLVRGRAGLRVQSSFMRFEPALVVRLLRVSVPAAADSLSMQLGYLWFLAIINDLGDTSAAAHGIALAWEALGYQSGAAFGTAATTMVGQSLGAKDADRAARGGLRAFVMGLAVMSFMGVLFLLLARPMFLLFCPSPSQATIVDIGVPVLRLVAFGMPALAARMIFASALRGAGDTAFPMLATWAGFFAVRIPLAYVLVGPLGLFGAWLAMSADLQVRGLMLAWRFAAGRWRTIRV